MRIEELPAIVAERAGHLLPLLQGRELPDPTGYHVMVLQYERQEKTAGGIYIAPKTHRDDKFSTRVGMVLALGPIAFSDKSRFGDVPWAKPGDWVLWPAIEGSISRFEYGSGASGTKAVLVLLTDDKILAVNVAPEMVVS